MDELYVEIFSQLDNNKFFVPLDSLITLFTLKYCYEDTNLHLILVLSTNDKPSFTVDLTGLVYQIGEHIIPMAQSCKRPLMLLADNVTCVAGLCAVLRQVIKLANKDFHSLLGFRLGCLMACAEVSLWTRFCEVDIIDTINCLMEADLTGNVIPLAQDILRFEVHMDQPLRIHNIRKKQQELAKLRTNDEEIVEHSFSEGPSMTLSDVILFPCYYILLNTIGTKSMQLSIPLTMQWYNKVMSQRGVNDAVSIIKNVKMRVLENAEFETPSVPLTSLYKSDPKRYKPANRVFTKQEDIETSLKLVTAINISTPWLDQPFGSEVSLNWDRIPHLGHPEGGNLPVSRQHRKREQLENLAKAVIKIAKPGDVIVDFCSGSGHLGLILAILLPTCRVLLLENKYESLNRARERGFKLNLDNVTYLQSNLDYFIGSFDLGVALHACGVATDLLIGRCINQRASFVCCPCCYGGVQETHVVTYPRSSVFGRSALSLRDYLVLGHAADQTHGEGHAKTAQGNQCMAVIDADRCQAALECNYRVTLSKLEPQSCTPKNNLLVGIPLSLNKSDD